MTALALINAQVYPMDPGHPPASGLLIREGFISQVLMGDGGPPTDFP